LHLFLHCHPHHLLERFQLDFTAQLHCYRDDSELFQEKTKFICGNEEEVSLISSTHPLFDVCHHFVFHIHQGDQGADGNPESDSNVEDADDVT